MFNIIPTAEPFFLQGNRTGILLIHGFTGTPKEMRWMGEYLNQQGYTCLGIRLNGHATDIDDMRRSRWTDWTASVEDGYHLLSSSVERVFLVGLSMGGALSLLMSTYFEQRVAGVVAMSTPYILPRDPKNYPIWFLKLYGRFVKYAPKSGNEPSAAWVDKQAFGGHVSYLQNPIHSVAELKLLLNQMQAALPDVRRPVLLIHSKDDLYVPPDHMEKIYARLVALHASDKTKLYVTGSSHVVTRDAARGHVFKAVLEFIRKVESQLES